MGQDEEQSPVKVEDRGLTTLHQPPDEQSVIADLVFVHGLQGHPRRTWQTSVTSQQHTSSLNPFKRRSVKPIDEEGAGVFWPADLIPQTWPKLRILTYGYDSKVTGLFGHGNSLLNALSRERTTLSNRPIIFVAHSLGGLVIMQTLVEARKRINNSDLHDIYTSAHAVIFFGTPHRGSDSAPWGLIASNLAKAAQMDSNDAILRDLDGSSKLLELRMDFHDILQDTRQQGPLQLYTFQEELGTIGLRALGGKVVTNESSSFDSPDYGYDSIHANHMNMCRFTGTTDDGYRKFSHVLGVYVQELADKRTGDEQAERQVQRESLDDPSIRKAIGRSELEMFSRRVPAKSGGLLEIIRISDKDDSDEDGMENAQDELNEDIDDNGIEGREEPQPKIPGVTDPQDPQDPQDLPR